MKMEETGCSETSAYKIQTPRNYLEESVQHSEHVDSLKSRIYSVFFNFPMPLASTAHNIILPLDKVRIRHPLLQSLHCKITSDANLMKNFVNVNMNKCKHCQQ